MVGLLFAKAARLVAEHGPDMPVPVLLWTIAADCPRMQAAQVYDVCGIHLPQSTGANGRSARHVPACAGGHLVTPQIAVDDRRVPPTGETSLAWTRTWPCWAYPCPRRGMARQSG